jgi:hypothetical protein
MYKKHTINKKEWHISTKRFDFAGPLTEISSAGQNKANEEFTVIYPCCGGGGRRGWSQTLYSENTISYMAYASSNLVQREKLFKIDFLL